MSMMRSFVRAFAAFSIAGIALSCDHDAEVIGVPDPTDDMFRSYVAIGNSVTAGNQSDGIDSLSQTQSYAVLLARQMRTRFAVPILAGTGCPPRVTNWTTGVRTGSGTSTTCSLRHPSFASDIINNVAVPGAAVTEVNNTSGSAFHNTLTTLILGGRTQVQRAIEADPTFLSIWIGNNDVLQAAATGLINPTPGVSRGITPVATFTARYDAMTDSLEQFVPEARGILVGVVQTASIPLLFPVSTFSNAAFLAAFGQAAGGTVTVHPNCTGSNALVSFLIVPQMRSGAHPRAIVCQKNTPGFPAPVGDIFILDNEDQLALTDAVTQYNTFIQNKATELDFAYYNPNTLLQAQRVPGGCIALFPDLAANPTTGSPFGTCLSFDGIHPSATGQRLIANAVIDAINTKYAEAGLTPVP
jgi:lysophospholipase L1-like esterase